MPNELPDPRELAAIYASDGGLRFSVSDEPSKVATAILAKVAVEAGLMDVNGTFLIPEAKREWDTLRRAVIMVGTELYDLGLAKGKVGQGSMAYELSGLLQAVKPIAEGMLPDTNLSNRYYAARAAMERYHRDHHVKT